MTDYILSHPWLALAVGLVALICFAWDTVSGLIQWLLIPSESIKALRALKRESEAAKADKELERLQDEQRDGK